MSKVTRAVFKADDLIEQSNRYQDPVVWRVREVIQIHGIDHVRLVLENDATLTKTLAINAILQDGSYKLLKSMTIPKLPLPLSKTDQGKAQKQPQGMAT